MIVLFAAFALADIPPPPGYEETCTVELVCASEQGVTCAASFNDRDACERDWGDKGYSKACKTRGASTWTEVWCSTAAPVGPDQPVQAPAEPSTTDVRRSSRCSSLTLSASWMLVGLGCLGLRRRR